MFIAIFLSIALFVCLDGYQTSRSDRTGSITSLQSGWGSWGQTRYCNDGEYAIGIKLKVEGSQGSGDDTSANSLGLLCGIYGTATLTETIYPSNGQQWGSWSEDVLCPTNHILGFKSKVESSQGGGDDTALNSIQIKCEDGSYNQPSNGGGWGNWGSLDECPSGSVVCGFRIKVESSQSGGDDTALNAIDLQCCSPTISYSEIKSSNGLCLDVHASCLYNNGCKVQLWSCNGEIQQQWYYNSITKTIKNKGGLCLDVHLPDLNKNGAKIQVWTCNNQNQQKFNINNDPINTQYKSITNYVGKCLDVHNVDHLSQINGGKVQTYSCGAPSQSSTNQLWTLSQLTTTTVQPTPAPTYPPLAPTAWPTFDPTEDPTVDPTPLPTKAPTTPSIGDCINVVGSYWAEDYQSEAECPSLYPVMTSCGIESSGFDNNDGTSISNSLGWCIAHSAHGSAGWVKAHARCCKLSESIICNNYDQSITNSINNLFTTISCPSNEYLTGCSSRSHFDNIDGSFPDILNLPSIDKSTSFKLLTNNDCNGKNEMHTSGVKSNAQCCKYSDSTKSLQCGRIWGNVSGFNAGDISTAICPTGYFMSGCSGYSDDASTQSWYINDNNQCISVNKINGDDTYAVGICCKEVTV